MTIADVARRAKVSTATVSRVLAGLGRARPETRARILAAAKELDYRPSEVARSLKLGTSRTFGLIITDIENPFFPQLVRAVEDAARAEGYALLLCNAADDPEREAAYLDLLVDRRVDGVVIAVSRLGARHREWLAGPPLPVVLVNSVPRGVRLPSVTSDNPEGGRLAAAHLIELGHRHVGVLTAGERNADAIERLGGVRGAWHDAGRDADDLVVVIGTPDVGGGETALLELLALAPTTTGVIAYNDLMAIGAIRGIRASGRTVPRDVSVVGFDDVALAPYADPPLTTIAQPIGELGRWAVERLIERIAGDGTSGAGDRSRTGGTIPHAVLPVRLVCRSSTGPVPLRTAPMRIGTTRRQAREPLPSA